MCGQYLFLARQTGLVCTGEALSAQAQGLVPRVPLEEEVYEGVVRRGALGEEARQERDGRRHLLLLLGVEHGPEAHRHVRGPGDDETQTDHEGHLQRKEHGREEEGTRKSCLKKTCQLVHTGSCW